MSDSPSRSGTLANMRGWYVPGLLCAMLGAQGAPAQSPATQGAPAQAPAQPLQVLRDADLHLTFSYPADLQPMDAQTVAEATGNARYGGNSGENTDAPQSGGCAKVLLSVGKVTEGSHGKAWGLLTMLDVSGSCIPPKALKSKRAMDNLLKPMVTGGTQVLGMMPLGQESAYLIQGYKVHFAGAQGQPVAKSDLQPAEQTQTIAHLAVAVGDHIVLWKIESNSAGLLNRMLASQVDFGAGPPQPLFPGQLQNDLQF
jgi:hypothetical protein